MFMGCENVPEKEAFYQGECFSKLFLRNIAAEFQ